MRSFRFYAPIALHVGKSFPLPDDKARHVVQVLRLAVGAEFVIFNGDGFEYSVRLTEAKKKHATVDVLTKTSVNKESSLSIHLLQGLSKGDRMDVTIQKCVELGVSLISPVHTSRSNVKLNDERADKKCLHWAKIIQSACEQSGRNVLPKLTPPTNFDVIVNQYASSSALKLILHPLAFKALRDFAEQSNEVVILVGPEGGFEEAELCLAERCGFISLSLGPRVLRTETAAMALIASLQARWGDL